MKSHVLVGGNEAREDDENIFGAMYDKYYPIIYNYAYVRLLNREAAEDVTSSVFLAVLTNFWRFDAARGEFKAWILTIARNLTQNHRQKAYVRREICVGEIPEQSYEGDFEEPENQTVHRILAGLSVQEREFLAMRYALDMTNSEIAAAVGISVGAVSNRYSRLLEKCRKMTIFDAAEKRGDGNNDPV